MIVTDSVTLGDARITRDGYLVTEARIARQGVQIYRGYEVGKPKLDSVRVYRPETEVFADAAMASFAHRPVTVDHPAEPVRADNWRKHAVGFTGDQVARDGGYIRVPLTLMDADAIQAVQAGKRQLSAGYSCDLDWTPGQTESGEVYDAIQKNIRGNHLAIVDAARAGPECCLDKASEDKTLSDKDSLKAITVDGLTIMVTDQGAQAIAKLQKELGDLQKDMAWQTQEDAKIVSDLRKTIEAKDGEIAALKSQILDAAALDKAIASRAALIDSAKALVPALVTDGKSDAQIRREAVASRLGDAAVANRSDDYVTAAFDTLVAADAKRPAHDPLRVALSQSTHVGDAAGRAHAEYLDRMANAWKGKAAAETGRAA